MLQSSNGLNYDIILGQAEITITSDTSMKNVGSQKTTLKDITQEVNMANTTKAADYSKPNPHNEASKSTNPLNSQIKQWYLLMKHEEFFQGKSGNGTGEPVTLRIKPDTKPKCAKPDATQLKNCNIFFGEME